MSNFAFIANQFPQLAEIAMGAEKLVYVYPPAVFATTRQSLETLVLWMYEYDKKLTTPYDYNLHLLLNDSVFKTIVPDYVWAKMDTIRYTGNKVIHSNINSHITKQHSIAILQNLFLVYVWFERTYSKSRSHLDQARTFKIELIPNPAVAEKSNHESEYNNLALQVAQLQNELKAKNEVFEAKMAEQHQKLRETEQLLAQQTADKEEKERLLAKIDSELAQKREEIAQAKANNEQYNATHRDPNDYKEAETRALLIDIMLAEAGWVMGKNMRTEVTLANFPNSSQTGKADYVLYGHDGVPLAVVEAKRSSKSVHAGQQQAKLYADSIHAQYGKRPIIFYSNGYETYLWDDASYPPRAVQGFYTQQELHELIERKQQRNTATCLSDYQINADIVERHYQTRAIKSLLNNFDLAQRKGLLVMATGTGKTRVSIALVEVLMRANFIKNVLFLADRTSLINQASKNFKALLPNTPVVNLLDSRQEKGRIYLSTYQTMMGLIDEKNNDGTRKFGIGFFDLIIIDEAHRSVYQKFGEIFKYFDSLLVGLTATPRDEVDRDTYHLFDLDQGVPTDYYNLDEAIQDGYLVPPKVFDVPLKFMRQGIKYDELSEAEKSHWESLDWGERETPDEVSASEINTFLFNTDTVDKMLIHLMDNGIKVQGGDVLGKTIIFAVNQRHAEFIAERFNHLFPMYGGKFARVITHAISFAQNLIDSFCKQQAVTEPQLVISVDMLDTGIDVPEVVNLVFFKAVRSKVKFMQMIGRGTRLSPNLFAPNQDKTEFYIFDYCGNFDFFNENPEGVKSTQTDSLTKRLFKAKLNIIYHLQNNLVHQYDNIEQKLRTSLQNEVAHMSYDNFIVRPKWQTVELFQQTQAWQKLDENAYHSLEQIAGLPTQIANNPQDDIRAKLFDLLCYNLQFAILQKQTISAYRKQITDIATDLSTKAHIPAVHPHIVLIEELLTNHFWENVDITSIEQVRENLRDLIKLTDQTTSTIVYTVLSDEIGEAVELEMTFNHVGVDIEQYKKRVTEFIRANENHVTIARLRQGKPLTTEDLKQLEQFIYNAQEVAGEQEFRQHFGNQISLPEFIRSLVGLDYQAVKQAFSQYLIDTHYNERQIRFIEMIIDELTKHGSLDASRLYEAPFNQIHFEGIDGLFAENEIDNIFDTIEIFNHVIHHDTTQTIINHSYPHNPSDIMN